MDEEELKRINPLEYRPDFAKEEREKTGWVSSADENESDEGSLDFIEGEQGVGEGLLTDIIEDFYDSMDYLNEFIEDMERRLSQKRIEVEDHWIEDVLRAKKELGLSSDRYVTHLDYKAALLNSDTSAGDFLLNVIERYIEDVNGSLQMELYGEAVEIREEMKLMELYIDKMVYPILGFTPEGEDWKDDLMKSETAWNDKKESEVENKSLKDSRYRNALLFEPKFVPSTRSSLHEAERSYDEIKHEIGQLDNTLSVVNKRADDTVDLTNSMMILNDKEINPEEVLKELFSLAENQEEENESLTNMQLMLKLAVDVYNKEKNQYKNNLRNTFSTTKQKSVLSELAVHEGLYRKKTLPLLHHMRGYQSDVSEETSELFNELAFGIEYNNKNRKDMMYESFLTTQATSIIRSQKLSNVSKKETARKGYQIAYGEVERRETE